MPRGASAKREREYKELKREFKKEHRYKGREEEVAARIVNKQRAQFGETKAAKAKDRKGKSPDRELPIPGYEHKTVAQIERAIGSLSRGELKKIERYEKEHRNRRKLLEDLRERVSGRGATKGDTRRKGRKESARGRSGRRTTAPRSRSRKARGKSGGLSGRASVTTDHDEIREWVEKRGGHPATVKATETSDREPGILRIDFPGYSGGQSLEEISWDEFFEKFDESELAFLHQDTTASGKQSRFNKLISRK